MGGLIEHYDQARAHESLSNFTSADVYLGQGRAILAERARIKRRTPARRRLQHHAKVA